MTDIEQLQSTLDQYAYVYRILLGSLNDPGMNSSIWFRARAKSDDYRAEILDLASLSRGINHNLNFVEYPLQPNYAYRTESIDYNHKLVDALHEYFDFMDSSQKIGNMTQRQFLEDIWWSLANTLHDIRPQKLVEVTGDTDTLYATTWSRIFVLEAEEVNVVISLGVTD